MAHTLSHFTIYFLHPGVKARPHSASHELRLQRFTSISKALCRDFLLIILPPVSWREKNTELGLRGVQIQKKSWRKSECLRLGRYHAQAHGLGLPA